MIYNTNAALSISIQSKHAEQALVTTAYPIYPKLGIISTVAGTLVALLLIPENPFPAGALYHSAVAMTVGLAFAPLLAALRQPRTILRSEHLLALSPIYWLLLDLLQSIYPVTGVAREAVQGAFLAIGLFTVSMWVAALTKPCQLPKAVGRSATQPLSANLIFLLILILFAFSIFKYAYPTGFNPSRMLYYLGQNRWAAPWSRGALGSWDAFLDHMSYFGYLLPTLTVLLAQRSRWQNPKTIFALLLSLTIIAFLAQAGGRRVIGVVFGAAIICWILEQKRFQVRHMFIMLLSAAALLMGMQYMLEYRNVGFRVLFIEQTQRREYEYLHVDDNFLRLAQVIHLVPNYHEYVYSQQVIYTLVRPIPRVFWPGKPTGPGFDLVSAVGMQGLTLSMTVIGELYISLGWFAVLLGGWFYGRIAHSFSVLLTGPQSSARTVVYGIATMMLFSGMRSMLDLVSVSYALLAWIFVSVFFVQRTQQTALESNRVFLK